MIKALPVNAELKKCAATLRAGEIIIYPTETCYGIGANALDEAAVQKVYDLKGRAFTKPLSIMLADFALADRYAVVDVRACQLANRFLPGPLTLVLPKRPTIPDAVVAGGTGVGIRVPAHWIRQLCAMVDFPIVTTSANASGQTECYSVAEVHKQLGVRWDLVGGVIDGGELVKRKPSTVVDLTGETMRVLRVGDISEEELLKL